MARVTHLFRAPKRRAPMEELPEARAVEDLGLEGCAHARPQGKRRQQPTERKWLQGGEISSYSPKFYRAPLGTSAHFPPAALKEP